MTEVETHNSCAPPSSSQNRLKVSFSYSACKNLDNLDTQTDATALKTHTCLYHMITGNPSTYRYATNDAGPSHASAQQHA